MCIYIYTRSIYSICMYYNCVIFSIGNDQFWVVVNDSRGNKHQKWVTSQGLNHRPTQKKHTTKNPLSEEFSFPKIRWIFILKQFVLVKSPSSLLRSSWMIFWMSRSSGGEDWRSSSGSDGMETMAWVTCVLKTLAVSGNSSFSSIQAQ